EKYHHYFGETLTTEMPRYSGEMLNLEQCAAELGCRLCNIFLRSPDDPAGKRPVFGDVELFQRDPQWRDHIPFFEYFHRDNGRGLGASHQTGWTALVARLLRP